MAKHELQEINAGSMADIAFLLLIFFLVTTTMDTDSGLIRKLPPEITNVKPPIVKKRNTLDVLVNRNNQLMVKGENIFIAELREVTKNFIVNPYHDEKLPEIKLRNVDYFGELELTPFHVISLQSDKGTSYQAYIAVQNELAAAYNELKEELAQKKYGKSYNDLKPAVKDVLDEIYSAKISEAEPVAIGAN